MRLVRIAAAALAGITLLAGCSDSGGANETLPSPSSTAAETSASLPPLGPPDLPMPAEAREQTEAGATAFSRYYLELINHTSVDMDSQYLRQLSIGCSACERIADETDSDAAAGYRYSGGQLSIDGELRAVIDPSGAAESAFVLDQAALQVVDSTGQPILNLSFSALADLPSGAAATWDQDLRSWRMTELTLG